jgi:hypothetical protein
MTFYLVRKINNVQTYVSTYDQSCWLAPTVSFLPSPPKEYRNISLTTLKYMIMILSDSYQLCLIVGLFLMLMYLSHPTIQLLGIVAGEWQKSYIEPICHQLMQTPAVLKYLFERFKYCVLISYVTVVFCYWVCHCVYCGWEICCLPSHVIVNHALKCNPNIE